MGAKPWKWESNQMLGMAAYVGLQSRGMPVSVATDGKFKDFYEKGKKIYYTRVGQLDMSCAGCHEDNYGKMIRADHLSQGNINGFPTYRFKWQKMGSIHRRFKGCMNNIRANPYGVGSDEVVRAWGDGIEQAHGGVDRVAATGEEAYPGRRGQVVDGAHHAAGGETGVFGAGWWGRRHGTLREGMGPAIFTTGSPIGQGRRPGRGGSESARATSPEAPVVVTRHTRGHVV